MDVIDQKAKKKLNAKQEKNMQLSMNLIMKSSKNFKTIAFIFILNICKSKKLFTYDFPENT